MAKFLVISEYQDPPSRPSFITRNDIHVKETKLKRMRIEINDKPENHLEQKESLITNGC